MVDADGTRNDNSTLPRRSHPPPPTFLEVTCKSTGAIRRFAPGTEAGFAVSVINRKLNGDDGSAMYIEAVRDGEEPVCFGPSSVLLDYGSGWILQTVAERADSSGAKRRGGVRPSTVEEIPQIFKGSSAKRTSDTVVPTLQYFGKIFLAFLLIFMLGGIFTIALENLPELLVLIQS